MEMKDRRGYKEMQPLLRRSNVNFSCMGEQLLEIAIMSYLQKPNQEKEQLLKTVEENTPMPISGGDTAFDLMKEALQNLYTRKSEKVANDEVVMTFISNIAEEIRISEVLKQWEAENEINISVEDKEIFVSICKRRLFKPQDKFEEILRHVAKRNGVKNIDTMVTKLTKYKKFDKEVTIKELIKKVEILTKMVLRARNKLIFN